MKNNFTRSNVNEETLQISSPLRSGFNLGHRDTCTPQMGRLVPVNFEPLLPTDIVQGKLNVDLALEKIMTPRVGRVRMDTHTFVVNARRINKDWQAFIQSQSDSTMSSAKKPAFDIYQLMANVFAFMVGVPDMADLGDLWEEEEFPDKPELSDLEKQILDLTIANYQSLLGFGAGMSDYGYIRDFIAVEVQRLTEYRTAIGSLSIPFGVPFGDFMAEFLKPYFGEASQFDQLGYPLITNKGPWCAILNSILPTGDTRIDIGKGNILDESPVRLFSIRAQVTESFVYFSARYLDEMPLRACYAAWYDYLRNWHVEKRQNILDPDLFNGTSILHTTSTVDFTWFSNFLQLGILKYRMFSRDPLTTVQTDDNFRHVYNPVIQSDTGDIDAKYVSSAEDIYRTLLTESFDNGTSAAFPSGLFARFGIAGTTDGAFKSDLQTMRRAGMLRKWLSRNYYFPDTYVGMVRARFGIEPGDTSSLISEYIGGTEQFISGDQQIANVTTDKTPVGSRTLVAGVAGDDSFTYHATDYCYLISFVSLVPMVVYDAANMHLQEISVQDMPSPEFAEDANVEIRTQDFLRGFEHDTDVLGVVPRYLQYRCHLDSNHGRFLTDYRDYNWSRDWYNMYFANVSQSEIVRKFSLNPYALRIHLPLNAFLGLDEWDPVAYGDVVVDCAIDRALPAAVEVI